MIYHIERFARLSSTNDYLKQLAESGAPEGTVVIAAEQFSGKGRLGRSWASPPGGAWFSLLLKPPIPVEQAGCISVLVAVSVARALCGRWGVPVGVKWPNDLYIRARKLGGILVELSSRASQIHWLIAGIGINVNNELPQETRIPATSLARELGREIVLEELFDVTLAALARDYERFLAEGVEFVQMGWQKFSMLPRCVAVLQDAQKGEAEVLGLAESGRLIVRMGGSIQELTAEEVTLCLP